MSRDLPDQSLVDRCRCGHQYASHDPDGDDGDNCDFGLGACVECNPNVSRPCGQLKFIWGGTCGEPATWDIAALDSDDRYSRAQSVCDEHLAERLREFYDGCIVSDDTAAQVRPYDPTLREVLD